MAACRAKKQLLKSQLKATSPPSELETENGDRGKIFRKRIRWLSSFQVSEMIDRKYGVYTKGGEIIGDRRFSQIAPRNIRDRPDRLKTRFSRNEIGQFRGLSERELKSQ
jgi:hypothetical protein